jgi:hypothetical protein
VRAALATFSVALVSAGCSTGVGSADTLQPLPIAPSNATTTVAVSLSTPASEATTTAATALTSQQQWYQDHRQAVTDHRAGIEVLRDQLAAAPDGDATVMLCVASGHSERPAFEQARQAPDVHPAWAEAVDLTRWMVASCSAGDDSSVPTILPLLNDALNRFDSWVDESATG